MKTDPPRLETPLQATLAGIRDQFGRGPKRQLGAHERLDGKITLLTGANRGLGLGIAQQLALRGGTLLLACRSDGQKTAGSLKGDAAVEALTLDLADPSSVRALVEKLTAREQRIDRLVLNAGLVPLASRQTASGLDVMFHVNFLGNVDLVERLLAADRLAPGCRIVFVSSESHRSGTPTLEGFGEPVEYGTSGVMTHYGQSKLYLTAYAQELSRALPADQVGVHALCPGAVASDIAREAPGWMKLLLTPAMKLMFASPLSAADPVVWQVCSEELSGKTGTYLHMHAAKAPADFATHPERSREVRERALELLERIR